MKKTLLFSCLLFFASCSPVYRMINPEYENMDFSNAKLLIMPIPEDGISVKVDIEVAKAYKKEMRDPDEIIRDSLYRKFYSIPFECAMNFSLCDKKPVFNAVKTYNNSNKCIVIRKKLGREKKMFYFQIPKKKMLEKHGLYPDIILVINSITVDIEGGSWGMVDCQYQDVASNFNNSGLNLYKGMSGLSIPTPPPIYHPPFYGNMGASTTHIVTSTQYVFYDYNNNKIIACGEEKTTTAFMFSLKERNLSGHYKNIVYDIFSKSPFNLSER